MRSGEHREKLLDPLLTHFGAYYRYAPGTYFGHYWTLVMAQAPGDAGIDTIEDPKEATTSADTRDYQDEGQVCCGPTETVSLYAFLELNDNGSWDGGEPWGADPNNPVTIEDDSYVSTIVVENDG